MAKLRSPVLGYNHNVKHVGWLFHVQTEDSGVQNPHIFTHLFHSGVIIATKKMVYDAESDVDVVKGLMQAQHKSVLKELKNGFYDAKITKYLGAPPEGGTRPVSEGGDYADIEIDSIKTPTPLPLKPGPEGAPPARQAASAITAPMGSRAVAANLPPGEVLPPQDVSTAFKQMAGQRPPAATEDSSGNGMWVGKPEITQERPFDRGFVAAKTDPNARPGRPPTAQQRTVKPPSVPPPVTRPAKPPSVPPPQAGARPPSNAAPVAAKPGKPPTIPPGGPPPRAGGGPPTSRPAGAPPASAAGVPARPAPRAGAPAPGQPNVIVARPAVIVGAPPQVVGGPAARPPTGRPREASSAESIFGKDLISEKSLDEVIMAYLSEDPGEE